MFLLHNYNNSVLQNNKKKINNIAKKDNDVKKVPSKDRTISAATPNSR